MYLPSFRSIKLTSAALAGVVVLSALVGPALLPASVGGSVAHAEVVVDINVFHDALSPYGRWVDSPRYGRVWYPTNVHRGWRPYYDDGHWAYSNDDGWIWASDAPWGWAPFHYGRWASDAQYGWIWVPGRVWGPAWVAFRRDRDNIGWAPLPPDADWDPDRGSRGAGDIDISFWSFVRPEGFTARRFDSYAVDRNQYRTIIGRTTNITNITVINNRIVNNSIPVNDVEGFTHQRVERLKITESDRPQGTVIKGNSVVFYKPAVVEQGEANAGANAKLQPAMVKEDPAQDNKKRFTNADGQPAAGQALEKNKKQNQNDNLLPVANTKAGQPDTLQTLEKENQNDNVLPVANTKAAQPDTLQTLEKQKKLNGGVNSKQNEEPLVAKTTLPTTVEPPADGGQNQNSNQPQVNTTSKKPLKLLQQQQPLGSGKKSNFEQSEANASSKKQLKLQQQDQQQQHQSQQGQPGAKKSEACGKAGQMPCQ
jgi:hypothetical protein